MFNHPTLRSILWTLLMLAGVLLCILPAALYSLPSTQQPGLTSQADSGYGGVLRRLLPEFDDQGQTLLIPISVYILDGHRGVRSSTRQEAELVAVIDKVNQIWRQADIQFQIQGNYRIAVSEATLVEMAAGEFRPFYRDIQTAGGIPSPAVINAFYAREIGGPNGINPGGTRLFFVSDNPTVHDERVTAHEIGHILGLHHSFDNSAQLMYPGTNGIKLTLEEITIARYIARGILNGLR